MNWNKAGRPSTSKEKKPEWIEQGWTKEEQSILAATEIDAMSMLAVLVVRQWVRDGKPKKDEEGIKPWINLIKDILSNKNSNKDQEIHYYG